MRGVVRIAGALLLTACYSAAADQLTVEVTGIERLGGHMMIAVYDDEASWSASSGAVAEARDSVTGPLVRVSFPDLPRGYHAVMLYHDHNSNGELDTNMLGIPAEAYGFSNNAGRLGRPDFDEARFLVDGDMTISIELR